MGFLNNISLTFWLIRDTQTPHIFKFVRIQGYFCQHVALNESINATKTSTINEHHQQVFDKFVEIRILGCVRMTKHLFSLILLNAGDLSWSNCPITKHHWFWKTNWFVQKINNIVGTFEVRRIYGHTVIRRQYYRHHTFALVLHETYAQFDIGQQQTPFLTLIHTKHWYPGEVFG